MGKKHKKNSKNKYKDKYVPDVVSTYSRKKSSFYSSPQDINLIAYEIFGDLHYHSSSDTI